MKTECQLTENLRIIKNQHGIYITYKVTMTQCQLIVEFRMIKKNHGISIKYNEEQNESWKSGDISYNFKIHYIRLQIYIGKHYIKKFNLINKFQTENNTILAKKHNCCKLKWKYIFGKIFKKVQIWHISLYCRKQIFSTRNQVQNWIILILKFGKKKLDNFKMKISP